MFAVSGGRVSVINTDKKNTVMQMQTAVTVYVNSKRVLLFAFERQNGQF